LGLPKSFGGSRRHSYNGDDNRRGSVGGVRGGRRDEDWSGAPKTKYDSMSTAELEKEKGLIVAGIRQKTIFSTAQCEEIERKIDNMVITADRNGFNKHTVDRTPLR